MVVGEGWVEQGELEHYLAVLGGLADYRAFVHQALADVLVRLVAVHHCKDHGADFWLYRSDEDRVVYQTAVEVVGILDSCVYDLCKAVLAACAEGHEDLKGIEASCGLKALVHQVDVAFLLVLLAVEVNVFVQGFG